MAEQEFAEVINLLEVEPSSGPAGSMPDLTSLTATGPDIPALREHLAVLVSTTGSPSSVCERPCYPYLITCYPYLITKYSNSDR